MRLLVFVLLLIPALSQAATVYQCADAKGRAIFSDEPCGQHAQRVTITPPGYTGVSFRTSAYAKQQVNAAIHQNMLTATRYHYDQAIDSTRSLIQQQTTARDRHIRALQNNVANNGTIGQFVAERAEIDSYNDAINQNRQRLSELQANRP